MPPASFPYGAYHEAEIQYLFDITTTLPPVPLAPDQQRLSDVMVRYWTEFARDASPNGLFTPLWIRLTERSGRYQRLVPPLPERATRAAFAADHECGFWMGIASGQ